MSESRTDDFKFTEEDLKYLSRSPTGPTVRCFVHGPSSTAVFVVFDESTKDTVLIDTCADYDLASGKYSFQFTDGILRWCEEKGLKIHYVMDTHVHADHLTAGMYIRCKLHYKNLLANGTITSSTSPFPPRFTDLVAQYGPNTTHKFTGPGYVMGIHRLRNVQAALPEKFPSVRIEPEKFHVDIDLDVTSEFKAGSLEVKSLFTPGHTDTCHTYVIGDALFTGDTMFMPDIGTARCDFPYGSSEKMWSTTRTLLSNTPTTRMFVGHDYPDGKGREFRFLVTVQEQKEKNVQVGGEKTMEEYVALRNARDASLSLPKYIFPALAWNLQGGFPPVIDGKEPPQPKFEQDGDLVL